MLIVAVLLVERLGMLDVALLLSKPPILPTWIFGTAWAFSNRGSTTTVGGGVSRTWSSNSSEWASLLVAIPESSSNPNRKWWLLTAESELSLHTFCFLVFASFERLFFSRKSILPQVHGTSLICRSFHVRNTFNVRLKNFIFLKPRHFVYLLELNWTEWKNKNTNKSSAYAIDTKNISSSLLFKV